MSDDDFYSERMDIRQLQRDMGERETENRDLLLRVNQLETELHELRRWFRQLRERVDVGEYSR